MHPLSVKPHISFMSTSLLAVTTLLGEKGVKSIVSIESLKVRDRADVICMQLLCAPNTVVIKQPTSGVARLSE